MQNIAPNAQQADAPAINLAQTSKYTCECGNGRFDQQFIARKASALLTGNGQTAYIPIPIFVCSECGDIAKDLIHPQVKALSDI